MSALDQFTFYRGRVAQAALLRALGVGRGDEVAIQAFTCSAVSEGVVATGARPTYVDISPGGYTMDPASLSATLTPRTRAVIVQHSFGLAADLPRLLAIAAAAGIPVLEDCAHAIGSTLNGRELGRWGAASFYSFEASKPVFAGIGGSALVNDPGLLAAMQAAYPGFTPPARYRQAQILAMYLAHRVAYRPSTFWAVRSLFRRVVKLGLVPGNYHTVSDSAQPVQEFHRRLGGVQQWLVKREIAALDRRTGHRNQIAAEYRARLLTDGIRHPDPLPGSIPVYGRYPLRARQKEALLRLAPDFRVELSDWYATPVHPLVGDALARAGYEAGSCPEAEQLTREVVSLPTGPLVDAAQIERTVQLFAAV